MKLGELIAVMDCINPLWIQRGAGIPDYYRNSGELLEEYEVSNCAWDLDEDIVDYVTLDDDGIITIEVMEV